jgi:hypothetical protein
MRTKKERLWARVSFLLRSNISNTSSAGSCNKSSHNAAELDHNQSAYACMKRRTVVSVSLISVLQYSVSGVSDITFDVFTVVTMKNFVFWDVTLYGSCKNQRFGGTYRLHHQGDKNRRARNNASAN